MQSEPLEKFQKNAQDELRKKSLKASLEQFQKDLLEDIQNKLLEQSSEEPLEEIDEESSGDSIGFAIFFWKNS